MCQSSTWSSSTPSGVLVPVGRAGNHRRIEDRWPHTARAGQPPQRRNVPASIRAASVANGGVTIWKCAARRRCRARGFRSISDRCCGVFCVFTVDLQVGFGGVDLRPQLRSLRVFAILAVVLRHRQRDGVIAYTAPTQPAGSRAPSRPAIWGLRQICASVVSLNRTLRTEVVGTSAIELVKFKVSASVFRFEAAGNRHLFWMRWPMIAQDQRARRSERTCSADNGNEHGPALDLADHCRRNRQSVAIGALGASRLWQSPRGRAAPLE